MGSFSVTHWLIVAVVVLILFGRGRISETMGEFGKGIRKFRKGVSEEESQETAQSASTILQVGRRFDEVEGKRSASE